MIVRQSRSQGERGVTLLELVVTLSILAMISVLVLQAFRLGSQSWLRGEERAEAEQRVRVTYGVIAQELASLHPVTVLVEGKPVVAFQGRPDSIFFHTAPAGYGPLPFSAMVRGVAYSVEAEKGLLVQESYPLVEGSASLVPRGPVRVLDPGVTRLKFRYLVPGSSPEEAPHWVEAWDPRDVLAAPPGARFPIAGQPGRAGSLSPVAGKDLPLAVEVRLVREENRGERETAFVFPIRIGQRL